MMMTTRVQSCDEITSSQLLRLVALDQLSAIHKLFETNISDTMASNTIQLNSTCIILYKFDGIVWGFYKDKQTVLISG